ncbi:MAG: tetratricopeptide repeat protein [Microscillaceae bacterium]|nr:tetratricopeptide repeat protein [Microscillaceae bacterium]MDW8459742.1 tetratricopeptide repeat protein [Cytophagales bacterium]
MNRKSIVVHLFTFFTFVFYSYLSIAQSFYTDTTSLIYKAEMYYQKALDAYEQNKRAEGLELLNKSLSENPQYYNALYARSYHFMEEGKYERAIKDYNLLLLMYPNISSLYLYRGNAYFNLQQYEKAEEDFLTAYELDSLNTEACNALGSLYYTLGLYEDAKRMLNEALQIDKENISAYYYRSNVYQAEGKYDLALRDIETALKIKPQDEDLLRQKAVLYVNTQKYVQAIAIFEQFEKQKTELLVDDFFYWGLAFYKQKKYDQALYYWKVPENHKDINIYQYIARAYYQKNDFANALKAIDNALAVAQEQQEPTFLLHHDKACILHKLKKKSEAEAQLHQAILKMPELLKLTDENNQPVEVLTDLAKTWNWENTQKQKIDSLKVQAYLLRTEAYLKSNNLNEALLTIDKAIALNPQNSYAYTLKGMCYAFGKQYQEALEQYAKALKLPQNQQLIKTLHAQSLTYFDLEMYPKALASIDEAIRKSSNQEPSLASFYSLKANIEKELNQLDQALASIDKAIQIEPHNAAHYTDKALILIDKNDYERALQEANKALQISKNDYLAFYSRGLAYDKLKKYSEAAADYAQVLQFDSQNKEVQELFNRASAKAQAKR